jgi:hypothetical protein
VTRKTKAKKKKAKAKARKTRKPSSSGGAPADTKKYQQQYYVTKTLIDDLETLRAKKEAEVQARLGSHIKINTSQFVGTILHDHVKKARKAGAL